MIIELIGGASVIALSALQYAAFRVERARRLQLECDLISADETMQYWAKRANTAEAKVAARTASWKKYNAKLRAKRKEARHG